MNIIERLFKKDTGIIPADELYGLNLDKPFVADKYAKKVIRHLANAIVETNRHSKHQHDVKVVFNCGYDESSWVGGSNYYIPIRMSANEDSKRVKVQRLRYH